MGSVHDLEETGSCVRLLLAVLRGCMRIGVNSFSLFSSGGIGDTAFADWGVQTIISNELLPDMHAVIKHNFPETNCITGGIWNLQNDIVSKAIHDLFPSVAQLLETFLITFKCIILITDN